MKSVSVNTTVVLLWAPLYSCCESSSKMLTHFWI